MTVVFENSHPLQARARRVLARLPLLEGSPLRIRFVSDLSAHGLIHAGSLVRRRRILLETSLAHGAGDLPRILVHELFHFAWLRLGNPRRRSWEELLQREIAAGAAGELGWSAEWRKRALAAGDRRRRTRRWREYACESFCDSAAWLFAGVARHPEFTLLARFRAARRDWFRKSSATSRISL
jgi:hypothetical protein